MNFVKVEKLEFVISLSPVFGVVIVEHEGFSLAVVFVVGYPFEVEVEFATGVVTIGTGLGFFDLICSYKIIIVLIDLIRNSINRMKIFLTLSVIIWYGHDFSEI